MCVKLCETIGDQSVLFCLSDTSQFSVTCKIWTTIQMYVQYSKHAAFSKYHHRKKAILHRNNGILRCGYKRWWHFDWSISSRIRWHWPVVMAWLDEIQACVTVCAGIVSGSPTLSITCVRVTNNRCIWKTNHLAGDKTFNHRNKVFAWFVMWK